jgi:hypothetical protein
MSGRKQKETADKAPAGRIWVIDGLDVIAAQGAPTCEDVADRRSASNGPRSAGTHRQQSPYSDKKLQPDKFGYS